MHHEQPDPRTRAPAFNLLQNWNHLLQRPASQEPVIDGVRALAILWVIALHLAYFQYRFFPAEITALYDHPATGWIKNGTLGVDFFFVISGFLMGSILFGEYRQSGGLNFPRFYMRRFLRLMPVYLVIMGLGLYFMYGLPGRPVWANAEYAWTNLLYVNNFLPVMQQYMAWCWSLAIEEQFYLLLPGCILLFMGPGRGRIGLLVGLMVLSVAIRYAVIHYSGIVPPFRFQQGTPAWQAWFDTLYDKPWMRFGGLLAGVTGAYLHCFRLPQVKAFFARTGLVTALSVGSLAIIAHVTFTPMGAAFFDRLPVLGRELWWAAFRDAFSLATMFLILAAMHTPALFGGWLRRGLAWRGFYPVAQLSYSLYLTHEMLFVWVFPRTSAYLAGHLSPAGAIAGNSVIALALTLALASLLYVAIERPCMLLRSHPAVLKAIEFFRRPQSGLDPARATGIAS